MHRLHLGKNCEPGKCSCGRREQMSYRCVTFIDEDKNRCGEITGPFDGEYVYMAQGHAHFWQPDDFDAMTTALDAEHGHDRPNYTVPVQIENVSPNYPPQ